MPQNKSQPSHIKLEDIAQILQISIGEVLHYGARGVIDIITTIPSGLTPFLVRNFHTSKPIYLGLSPCQCARIELNGEIEAKCFKHGYELKKGATRDAVTHLSKIELQQADGNFPYWMLNDDPDGSSIYYSNNQSAHPVFAKSIKLNKSNLLIHGASIQILESEIKKNYRSQSSSNIFQFNLDANEFKQLADLFQTAQKFWGNADAQQKDTFPRKKEVQDYLESYCNFVPSNAKVAATIITPTYAHHIGRPKKTTNDF